ncbi:MAG: hypothetical protein OXP09_09915 [Gammaproteobacteria bacterium]|nr:hypothetical protein [Gammaproteobacteria bacterium]MDE0365875.1 hypothetical protein [Gammaproteobacteria bacterium]
MQQAGDVTGRIRGNDDIRSLRPAAFELRKPDCSDPVRHLASRVRHSEHGMDAADADELPVAQRALLAACGEPDLRTEPNTKATAAREDSAANDVELAPRHWPEGMLERFRECHNTFETERACSSLSDAVAVGGHHLVREIPHGLRQ